MRCAASAIAGAGLDVWDKEPPAADHPLLQFDNVIASPHTAGVTREARTNMGKIAAEQMLAWRSTASGRLASSIRRYGRPMRSGSRLRSAFARRPEPVFVSALA